MRNILPRATKLGSWTKAYLSAFRITRSHDERWNSVGVGRLTVQVFNRLPSATGQDLQTRGRFVSSKLNDQVVLCAEEVALFFWRTAISVLKVDLIERERGEEFLR